MSIQHFVTITYNDRTTARTTGFKALVMCSDKSIARRIIKAETDDTGLQDTLKRLLDGAKE